MTTPLLVVTNLPDRDSAEKLARIIVGEKVAACVNILAPCRSVYAWEGKVEEVDEVPVLIKTTADRYERLELVIQANHPYSVPEVIALAITTGLPAYLQWLTDETRPPMAA
jgi:periplasmic divalent cation tolerance protein